MNHRDTIMRNPCAGLVGSGGERLTGVPLPSLERRPFEPMPKPVRITFAPGQDVLPVFSPDSTKVMWTSSRDGRSPTQLYIADFTPPKDE